VNVGKGSWENPVPGTLRSEICIEYVEDKAAKLERITVPAYVVASWSNPIHSYGTFRAFAGLKDQKWLRVHDSWEWPDYYDEANRADLHRFYDHFLKDIDNGWQTTPLLRAKILDTASPLPLTGTSLVSSSFPPREARPFKFFLHPATKILCAAYPFRSSTKFITNSANVVFEYMFPVGAIICGPLEMQLAISLNNGTDANIFVTAEKVTKNGAVGKQLKVPYEHAWQSRMIRMAAASGLSPEAGFLKYSGSWGRINVARRLMVEGDKDVPGMPICRLDVSRPLKNGQIDLVRVPMVPMGMSFKTGEKLRVTISGKDSQVYPPVDQATLTVDDVPDPNASGVEVEVHAGMEDLKMASFINCQVIRDW
jgi:predicted acyl esterase